MTQRSQIPVIDIFAGPGGLGEGFSQYVLPNGTHPFAVALSIEKDPVAHETLLLRSFFRQSDPEYVPEAYYEFLRGEITRRQLFEQYPGDAQIAENDAWCAELGVASPDTVRERIRRSLGDAKNCVLIGGPPCQAYSLVGRSRNKGNPEYRPKKDRRQFLYVEYLQVIADHWPVVFVMENVKGLLSAKIDSQRIFDRIHEDLESPAEALRREERSRAGNSRIHGYKVYSAVAEHGMFGDDKVSDFLVRAEDFGIPQARHRLILIGVREDLGKAAPERLERNGRVTARDVLDNLPRLRSGLSREDDDREAWLSALRACLEKSWLKSIERLNRGDEIAERIRTTVHNLKPPRCDRGAEFVRHEFRELAKHNQWYRDKRLEGVCNHSTRGHIKGDLYRYLFAACFAQVHERSPDLADFPKELRPDHENVKEALEGSLFADRFRVQLANRPSTTVTSHISKDGHYYIHYDPSQCRSLTVREAARLQTFPDNYFFCGPRTSQYIQVGNAVPPLLARGIAEIVYGVLKRSGLT